MATITYGWDQLTGTGASVTVIKLTSAVTAGDMLAACIVTSKQVVSVTDNLNNRWIQGTSCASSVAYASIWSARGVQPAAANAASVTVTFTAAPLASVNISDWHGVWTQSPIDTWSQNLVAQVNAGTISTMPLSPRQNGDLFIGLMATGASLSGPLSPYTALNFNVLGTTDWAAAYWIQNGASVSSSTSWHSGTPNSGIAIGASFLAANNQLTPGAAQQLNALLQFPEVMVQICEDTAFLNPINQVATWTDVTSYVKSFSIGPMGRQHELDRVQSTTAQFTMNGRDGTFNAWNTLSFLYPGGLDPMSPIRVIAAWNGITSPIALLYAQSFDPHIVDVQNVDIIITAYDILQEMSLAYISDSNYANAVLGGT